MVPFQLLPVAGQYWITEAAGTVDSVVFSVGDKIISLVNNASTTTYLSNWFRDPVQEISSNNTDLTGVTTAEKIVSSAITDEVVRNLDTEFVRFVPNADPASDVIEVKVNDDNEVYEETHFDTRTELVRTNEFFTVQDRFCLVNKDGTSFLEQHENGVDIFGTEGTSDTYSSGAYPNRIIKICDTGGDRALTSAASDGDCFWPRIVNGKKAIRFISGLSGVNAPFVMLKDGKSRMIFGDGVLRAVYAYGQSLSVGVPGSAITAATTTPLNRGTCLMPKGADNSTSPRIILNPVSNNPDQRRAQATYDDVGLGGLVDLREGTSTKCGETYLSRLASQLQASDGYANRHPLVFATAGVGGSTYDWLDPMATPWANLRIMAHMHKRIANDLGLRFEIAALIWTHGHSNATASESVYSGYMGEIQAALNALAVDLGQSDQPLFVTSGTATSKFGTMRSEVPIAQLNFTRLDDDRLFAFPEYQIEIGNDGTHPTVAGYQKMGDLYGMAIREKLFGTWNDFLASGATGAGTSTVTVALTGADGVVAIDTSVVSDPGNYGFKVYDDGGEKTISAVSLTGSNVNLSLTTPLGSNPRVDYALTGAANAPGGPTSGPRGCVRDSRSDAHRYLPAFTLIT